MPSKSVLRIDAEFCTEDGRGWTNGKPRSGRAGVSLLTSLQPRPPIAGRFVRLRVLIAAFTLATFLAVGTSRVRAAGEEYSRQAADLVLTVDARWAGCGHGGYYPLRIKVTNRGVDCDLTFQFVRQGPEAVPTVQRAVRLAQNSTARLTLSIPCVGDGSYGALHVYRNGRLVKDLSNSMSLPDNQGYGAPRSALLVISPTNIDAAAFESAVTSIQHAGGTSPSMSYGYYGSISEDHQLVGPELLPDSWIDYSGLDFVAISLKTLKSLAEEERAAILKWVHCGGTLIVTEVGTPAAQSQDVEQLLGMDSETAAGPVWTPADVAARQKIAIVQTDEFGNVVTATGPLEAESIVESQQESWPGEVETDFDWPAELTAFAGRRALLGYVYAFPENPFPGTAQDWAWFLRSVPESQHTWTERHGFAARRGTDEFLKFLIPSVKGVPVLAFLLLITLFTIVIGPLNYLWLWKKRRLYLLVITIPAIAMGTSCTLLGYSAIAHGFSTKSRARTLTLLDQGSNTAVSVNRISLYSGLAPSDGLQFSPETAVYPLWPESAEFQSGTVDWTERNRMLGWLRSRTRTQFLTVSHRDERGRLWVSPPVDGRMHVENGLEWALDALVVSDEAGGWFYGKDIAAGAAADLTACADEQRQEFVALLQQHPLVPPQTSGRSGGFFDWTVSPYFMHGGAAAVRYDASLQEQALANLQRFGTPGGGIEPKSYAAIVSENPGIELGIDHSYPQASLHVLMGRY